jgi:osmoprotectant transport system permease protein
LRRLEGRISETEMARMNARAKLEKVPERRVAADFLATHLGLDDRAQVEGAAQRMLRHTLEHLALVSVSLVAAILVAPLGIFAARHPRLGRSSWALPGVGSSLAALLVFAVPLLGRRAPGRHRPVPVQPVAHRTQHLYRAQGHPFADPGIGRGAGVAPNGTPALVELPMALRSILAGMRPRR